MSNTSKVSVNYCDKQWAPCYMITATGGHTAAFNTCHFSRVLLFETINTCMGE